MFLFIINVNCAHNLLVIFRLSTCRIVQLSQAAISLSVLPDVYHQEAVQFCCKAPVCRCVVLVNVVTVASGKQNRRRRKAEMR